MATLFPLMTATPFGLMPPGEVFIMTARDAAALAMKAVMNVSGAPLELVCIFKDIFGGKLGEFPRLVSLAPDQVVFNIAPAPEFDVSRGLPGRPDPASSHPSNGTLIVVEVPAQPQAPGSKPAHTITYIAAKSGSDRVMVDLSTGTARFPHLPTNRLLIDAWAIVLPTTHGVPQILLDWPCGTSQS